MESFNKSLGAGKGCKTVTCVAGDVITAKMVVALDTGATDPARVIPCTDVLQPVGIALEAASAAGALIAVAVSGTVEDVPTDGNVTVGKTLVSDGSSLLTHYANTSVLLPFALSLETDDATPDCDIWLFGVGVENIGY